MKTQVAVCKEMIDLDRFVTPRGIRPDNKPETGGFWTSTLTANGKSGWLEFAEKEGIYSESKKQDLQVYHIDVANSARVLLINTIEDFEQAVKDYGFMQQEQNLFQGVYYEPRLNYDKLMKDYDALSVTSNALHENFLELYGWDCESTIWFNMDHLNVKLISKGIK